MVGEIRDGETAEIALKASQTGHLVLSTLHTNDSVSSITRLIDLGVPSYLIASSVTGVMAQRLVRRLCSCCEKVTPTSEYIRKLETIDVPGMDSFTYEYKPVGCPSCESTGFKGRVGIYELLLVEGRTRDAIHSAARAEEIHSIARSAGFRTMQEDAIEKIRTGMTSLQEVPRVVPFDSVNIQRCESCLREVMANFVYCPFCAAVVGNLERPLALR